MSKLPIPVAALENHVGILGKTGSGKSNTAKVLVEYLLDKGERVCAIDPTGTWWGLRSNAKGNGPGYPVVIFGGQHGDVPLAGTHGAALAEIVGTTSTPTIIDTRLLSVNDRTKFFTAFAEGLLRVNKGPLYLVIDEAHLFAPQVVTAGGVARNEMLHAANNLVSLGRGIGLRIILVSQRPAKLHNDSLSQVETLIAMRLIIPHDREAVEWWVKEWASKEQGKDLLASLPALKTGEGWVWAPGLDLLKRTMFPLASTLDTGNPAVAERKRFKLAPIDLPAVHAQLEAVKIEAKANDPTELKAELAKAKRKIADLEKRPAAKAPVGISAAERERMHHQSYDEGHDAGVLVTANLALKTLETIGNAIERLISDLNRTKDKPAKPRGYTAVPGTKFREQYDPKPDAGRATAKGEAVPARSGAASRLEANDACLSSSRQRILDALAWLETIGRMAPDRTALAFVAGVSSRSGGYFNNLGALRTSGLIDYPGPNLVALTDAGRAIASAPDTPLTHQEIMRLVRQKLPPAQIKILDALVDVYPGILSRADLADMIDVSPTSGGYFNNLGRLRTLGLITYPSPNNAQADDRLFPGEE